MAHQKGAATENGCPRLTGVKWPPCGFRCPPEKLQTTSTRSDLKLPPIPAARQTFRLSLMRVPYELTAGREVKFGATCPIDPFIVDLLLMIPTYLDPPPEVCDGRGDARVFHTASALPGLPLVLYPQTGCASGHRGEDRERARAERARRALYPSTASAPRFGADAELAAPLRHLHQAYTSDNGSRLSQVPCGL